MTPQRVRVFPTKWKVTRIKSEWFQVLKSHCSQYHTTSFAYKLLEVKPDCLFYFILVRRNYIENVKGLHGSAGRANACIPKRNLIGSTRNAFFFWLGSTRHFDSPPSALKAAGNAPLPYSPARVRAGAASPAAQAGAGRCRGKRGEAAPRFRLTGRVIWPRPGGDGGVGKMKMRQG